MQIFVTQEDVNQVLVLGDVRQYPKLDLRVVGGEKHLVGPARDEGAADLHSQLPADRDVLEIRLAAAQPPGGRHSLVERGMDAAGLRVGQRRQCIHVS